MKIQVRTHFDAAHRLLKHPGKCSRLHGHRFEVEVEIESNLVNEETGMLIDYGDIKKIVDLYDHKVILSPRDPLCIHLSKEELMIIEEPTSEVLSSVLISLIMNKMKSLRIPGKVKVGVWESPNSMAETVGSVT